ncbi:MAG: penicillin-binding protein 1A [Dongiaceae bacterium]
MGYIAGMVLRATRPEQEDEPEGGRERKGRRRPARARPRRSWGRRLLRFTLKWTLVCGIWAVFVALCLAAWFATDLPDLSRLEHVERRPSVTLLAADGTMLASYGDLYGNQLRLSDMPAYLPEAVIATEDRRFYDHFGLDPIGILRAIVVNLRTGHLVQGGSTITQQLAKNIFLTPERTVRRKGQEVLLALWLEWTFSKDQILELYLNRVYLGAGTYGVEAASRKYFGKPAARLTVFEAATLAGMLKAPSRANPLSDPTAATERARLVLDNMVAAGYLTSEQEGRVRQEASSGKPSEDAAPSGQYFADWVLDQVSSYVNYVDRDLVVRTTLDPRMQKLAETELSTMMTAEGPKLGAGQAALVSLDPGGSVRAMVGGRDYRQSQFNRATQAMRQPGSAFKAFVFLAAFEHGWLPDSHMIDTPFSIGGWKPDNYKDKYYGDVSLREAFARSLNSVAVQLSERVGRRNVTAAARRLGITSPLANDASIALGTSEVTLLELTAAYAPFDNGGYGVLPHAIEEIRDGGGNVLYRRAGSGPGRVVAPRQVLQMLDIMGSVVDWGTGTAAKSPRPAAGKTGTSQDFRDAWFVGFTAELVTGIWFGNDDNKAMDKVTGGSGPARLWKAYMTKALADRPIRRLPVPQVGAEAVAQVEPPAASAVAASPAAAPAPAAPSVASGGAGGTAGAGSMKALVERLQDFHNNH